MTCFGTLKTAVLRVGVIETTPKMTPFWGVLGPGRSNSVFWGPPKMPPFGVFWTPVLWVRAIETPPKRRYLGWGLLDPPEIGPETLFRTV